MSMRLIRDNEDEMRIIEGGMGTIECLLNRRDNNFIVFNSILGSGY
jgi:hypothetical protein